MTGDVPLGELNISSVDNVYLFIADAVRYDFVPERVASRGRLFKMAAAALCTPQSMSSIATGQYAPRHGVTWFNDSLNDSTTTLFDLDVTSGYNEVVWRGRAIQDVIKTRREPNLETVEEPFVVLEHDNGGHSPYVGFKHQSTAEMFSQISDERELRNLYRKTIDESTARFEERLRLLEERGLLKNTLVIYLADHGELLGEHGGFVGHGLPSTPEVAYVPAVFIHHSLPNDSADAFLQHVDLLPTIKSIVGDTGTRIDSDGESLLAEIDPNRPAYTQGIMRPQAKYRDTIVDPNYDAPSVWTKNGGYVFNNTNKLITTMTATYDALFSGYTGSFNSDKHISTRLLNSFRHYFSSEQMFGAPSISKTEARRMVDQIASISVETESRSLDEETKDHLEMLGYR
ncbi:sulfatase-like hydrolase/transferase [Halosolutus halophilus]|uniref:sulfatase-like hydrolase/transferase n=1 Tax=Halosolutus halophilus TaxID=1552990 RepID=UPI002234F67C|nr:sulfatase-like hydrolase/transferase [Halosolutus halophilus]